MRSTSKALVAAVTAASWCIVPVAYSQTDETSPPASSRQNMQEPMPRDQPSQPDGAATGSTSQSTGEMAGATTTASIDQRKIEQFADAYVEVQTIQQQANAELETETDPAKADQVKTAAQSDMIAAVERSGLQIEEFNQIVASMVADTQLRSRVSAEVQKRVGGAPNSGT